MALTIHHLQTSQSERLPWLCEELNIPYTLVLHQRAPIFSPESIKTLHPLGSAPILQDGDLTLAESSACVEYIINIYGGGRLALKPGHKNYAAYLYWFHFANCTLQPAILMQLQLSRMDPESKSPATTRARERFEKLLGFVDGRLRGSEWLAGEEFTAADVMTVFSFTTMRVFYGFSLGGYEGILEWLRRCVGRRAYVNAREKADRGLELMVGSEAPRGFVERLKSEGKL
ncbi:uncharacterized protein KY384_000510 [Bacidia gigantensis]|uniref:uncharacterized protein n=1 Tax=Bacidia gigantensis TaxID=2732470 RepID=UPI001D039C60|nr:uncharacterized protein KY384_000510 [Bacidia gigantensis]KAG8525750.1 hypothetical protein KY384_000510 [Bacidia gigantensis]